MRTPERKLWDWLCLDFVCVCLCYSCCLCFYWAMTNGILAVLALNSLFGLSLAFLTHINRHGVCTHTRTHTYWWQNLDLTQTDQVSKKVSLKHLWDYHQTLNRSAFRLRDVFRSHTWKGGKGSWRHKFIKRYFIFHNREARFHEISSQHKYE